MIIQVRGTSGSGKTTVMRKVMEQFDWEPVMKKGRRKPLYYVSGSLAVLGHYEESACGGGDTIGSAPQIFKVIQEAEVTQSIILCEGLLLSEDVKWAVQMNDLHVFYLTTSTEECLQRIQKRRQEAGNDKPLNPHNTVRRVGVIEKSRRKLTEAGIPCRRCSSVQAPALILNLIRLHADQGE